MPIINCKIGDNVTWHHEELINLYGCTIGYNTKIGTFVEIGSGVTIGHHCRLQSFVFIPPGVEIGDHVFIGPHVCFTNVKLPKPGVDQRDCLLKTRVGNGVMIGANATILPGITIGDNAVIGAGVTVTKSIVIGQIVK